LKGYSFYNNGWLTQWLQGSLIITTYTGWAE